VTTDNAKGNEIETRNPSD